MSYLIIKIYKKTKLLIDKFKQKVSTRVDNFGAQYIAFGVFGVLNYPIYYLIWKYLASQSYESFGLRLTATLLCIPLILKNYWPRALRSWLPVYWYITLLFCLPFFFSFMLLKNHATDVWLMSTTIVIVWLMLLVDWLSFIILLMVGILSACLAYDYTTNVPFEKAGFLGLAAQYIGSLAVVLIFAHNSERLKKEKLATIKTIGASIAHELRTPIRTIATAADGIKKYLPILMKSYELAKKENLLIEKIDSTHYEALLSACDYIESETTAAFTVIKMLSVNVNQTSLLNENELKTCLMSECVDEALRRYPFDVDGAEKVHWQKNNDFYFKGDELLVIHILFNLLKNALFYLKAAGHGEIWIWLENSGKKNKLHFKDTGTGMSSKTMRHIFNQFFSKTPHGTGIGLTFCKLIMQRLNGDITCSSEEGEYTEFVLVFPAHPTLKLPTSSQ